MPRRYYYGRRSYRGSRPKRKWCPALIQGTLTVSGPGTSYSGSNSVLCSNAPSSVSTVPVATVIKVKNFKVVLDVDIANSLFSNVFVCIMYIPEAVTVSNELPLQHPEWILVWRTIDVNSSANNSTSQIQNLQMSSRLARNLNSGDKIILFTSGYYSGASTQTGTYAIRYYCSFVTCNN